MSVASLNVCANHSCWIASEGSTALCRFSLILYKAAGLGSNSARVGIFIFTYKLLASVLLDKLLRLAVFSWLYRLITLSVSAECTVQAAILAYTLTILIFNSEQLENFAKIHLRNDAVQFFLDSYFSHSIVHREKCFFWSKSL